MNEIFGIPHLKKGSGIYIKKKNRGKFTEYCGGKVTDECISRAKKSKNPKLRKRATFAANARGWVKKHLEGGIMYPKYPAYYINFNRQIKDDKGEQSLRSKLNNGLRKINSDFTHAGFMYIQEDGTPVFKEYGIKNNNTYWGNRVDLSQAPKYQLGQDPQQYFLSIYKYLNPISEGVSSDVVLIPDTNPSKIEEYIKNIDDSKYRATPLCNGQTCGSVAFNSLMAGRKDNNKELRFGDNFIKSTLDVIGSKVIPDGEEYMDRLKNYGYNSFIAQEYDAELEEQLRQQTLKNSRNKQETTFDFKTILDKLWFMPLGLLLKNGHTCIFNGTGCTYPERTLARNKSLVKEPEKYGYREIPLSEVKPGDAIILHNSKGEPKHFTIFDGVVPEGTKPYYYADDAKRLNNKKGLKPRMVEPGDTLLNYSPGTPQNKLWRKHAPMFRFESQYNTAGGDFSGQKRYYRATGKFLNNGL